MTRQSSGFSRTPWYVLTGGLALIFLFPLLWSAVASVSPQGGTAQAFGYGLNNYQTLLNFGGGLVQTFSNSVFVSVLTVILTLCVSVFGGYAFARFQFPGKNVLFLLTIAILMVPYATLLIPLYVFLGGFGLKDSLVGLAFVFTLFQLPFATFMMRISFEAIPMELEESALVDGAGSFAVLRRILLPLVVPGIVTVGDLRLPGCVERLHHAAHPDQRHEQVPAAAGRHGAAAADHGGHRLRRDRGGRDRDGHPLHHHLHRAPAVLRPRVHVRGAEGMIPRWSR